MLQIGHGALCNDTVYCTVGQGKSGGLFSLVNELNGTGGLILMGKKGLEYLLGLLDTIKSKGDDWFNAELAANGVLASVSALAMADPFTAIVGILGVSVTGGAIAHLIVEQTEFNNMIDNMRSLVSNELEPALDAHPNWSNYEFIVGEGPSNSGWQNQSFSIDAYAPE